MHKSPNLLGREFGYLKVLHKISAGRKLMWACRCTCGVVVNRPTESLLRGSAYSCGCKKERGISTHNYLDQFLYRHPATKNAPPGIPDEALRD